MDSDERSTTKLSQLPSEILSYIFLAGTQRWRESYPTGQPFPLLVSSTCHSWRLIAHHTPELWTSIVPPLPRFATAEEAECWTREWSDRCGVLSISLVLDSRIGSHATDRGGLIKGALQGIQSRSQQLSRLDIWSSGTSLSGFKELFELAGQPRNLIQLSFSTFSSEFIPDDHLLSLRKLRLGNRISQVFPNITTLSVHSFPPRNARNIKYIFAALTGIETLILPNLRPVVAQELPINIPVLAGSLTSIAVSFAGYFALPDSYLFNYLKAPNLKYLEIGGKLPISIGFEELLGSCKLECLRLSQRPGQLARTDQILLRRLTDLRHLDLVGASPEGLLTETINEDPLVRKRSIGSLIQSSASNAGPNRHTNWPCLTSVGLDTISAEDVMHLCRFINLHRQVATVRLSNFARRHLSGSLVRDEDIVSLARNRLTKRNSSDSGTKDVEVWLSKLVEVEVLHSGTGMLDGENAPLRELP